MTAIVCWGNKATAVILNKGVQRYMGLVLEVSLSLCSSRDNRDSDEKVFSVLLRGVKKKERTRDVVVVVYR